jgi:hypothetical protein
MDTDSSMHERVIFFSENLKEIENLRDLGTQEYNSETDHKEIEFELVNCIYLAVQ